MSRTPTKRRTRQAQLSARKRFWEMASAELQQATEEFDKEFVADTFADPNPAQRKQLVRAKRRRGRPRVGEGVRVISVSVEKGLLQAIDKLAKRKKAKRAELIAEGLRAILDGRVPLSDA